MKKLPKKRVRYTPRRVRRAPPLYNPFTAAYVIGELLDKKYDIKNVRNRLLAFAENDDLWRDIEIAVEAQRRIQDVRL